MSKNSKMHKLNSEIPAHIHQSFLDLGVPESAIGAVHNDLMNTQQAIEYSNPQDKRPLDNNPPTFANDPRINLLNFNGATLKEIDLKPVASFQYTTRVEKHPPVERLLTTSTATMSFREALNADGNLAAASQKNQDRGNRSTAIATPKNPDVVPNIRESRGDHRFPPIRPPLDSPVSPTGLLPGRPGIARPDQQSAMSAALAAWPAEPLPANAPKTFEAALAAIATVMRGPASLGEVCAQEPNPYQCFGGGPTTPVCSPASFYDPEHAVTALKDCQTANNSSRPTKVRYLTNGDANRLWRLQDPPTSRKVFNEHLVALPAALDAGRFTGETASAPSSGRLTLTAAQSMRRQETPGMSLQLVPRETPMCISNEPPRGGSGPLVQIDDRAPHGRDADFEDRRLHTIIAQLMVQVGPLQMRVLALASISPAGDRRMRSRLHLSSSNAVRHAGGGDIGWIISESNREMPLSGSVGEDDCTAARGLASCGSLGSRGASASSGDVSATGNSSPAPAPRLSLRQKLQAQQQAALGHTGQQGALVRPIVMSGGRIPVPAGTQPGRNQKSPRLPPSAVVAGGGGLPARRAGGLSRERSYEGARPRRGKGAGTERAPDG